MQNLKLKNPDLPLYSVLDPEFAPYGRVITDIDSKSLIEEAKKIALPEEGSAYTPSIEEFEKLPIKDEMQGRFFGALDAQIGYCYGHNSFLNALEWHIGSEINVAVTPFVLFLALQSDIRDNKMDSSSVKAFYVPEGTTVEVYESVLHFCPCETSEAGFGCVVGLLKGTNIPHETPVADKVLFKKNKYLIAHNENTGLIEKGIVAGISGKNLELKY